MEYKKLSKLFEENKDINGIRMLNKEGKTLMVTCTQPKIKLYQEEVMGEKFTWLCFGSEYSKPCHNIITENILSAEVVLEKGPTNQNVLHLIMK